VQASRALLQKQQQAELEEQRRKNRRLRRWVVAVVVILVLALGAGVAVYTLWETTKQVVASMGATLSKVKLQEIDALQKKAQSYEESQEYDLAMETYREAEKRTSELNVDGNVNIRLDDAATISSFNADSLKQLRQLLNVQIQNCERNRETLRP
ncbi:MAG: hypothetical protein LH606_00890, partial [Cytophagaceae bacterium]|nr:hypothetical protein [Cytophagaceae bacterium]